MAILTGAIKYRGSFKSIRNYRILHDPNVYAGEKGGANRELILNNPAFVRTRENMSEFSGVGIAARGLRLGFLNLIPAMTDAHLMARLIQIAKMVNLRDFTGARGKRSVLFSANRTILKTVEFNLLNRVTDTAANFFSAIHPITRVEATLTVTGLAIKSIYRPEGATHFRVVNHLSTISDFVYDELNRRYEPMEANSGLAATTYSEYTAIDAALTETLQASFPTGVTLGDAVTVIQCLGIEFSQKLENNTYVTLSEGGAVVVDAY